MEGVRCDDDCSSPAIDRCRIGMRAVDEIRQQEYDKLCSEGRWTSPFAFITEERLRRSEWGSFTAQQIYVRDFLVSRGSDKRRTTEEEAKAKLAYVYRSGEEMTESDDEDLRAQSTPGFYEHSSRLNWRHSLVELPRRQKERERFKAVIEMRKFSFVLVDERTKAELDYFQALPAQARHSIARTKPTTWHVFEETPGRNASPSSSNTSSSMSACDLAPTTSGSDPGSATSACDLAGDEESAGERTLPSPRPSIGCESSATDDEESDGREGWPSSSIFASPSRNNVTATTPYALFSSPNDFERREKAPVQESFDDPFDESDSLPQDDHSTNSLVAEDFTSSVGCSRRLINSKQRLGRCADGTVQAGTTCAKGGGSGRGSKDGGMYGGAEVFRETGSANSCGGSVGIDGGGGGGGSGGSGGEGACAAAAAASGNTLRSTPAPAPWTIGRTEEWAATSSATDGGGSTGSSGGCGSGDINHHPNSSEGRFRQKTCSPASTWASHQQDYNVSSVLPAYQGRASPPRKTIPVGAGNNHKDKDTCGVSRSRPLTSTYLLSTTTSDSDEHGNSNGGSGGGGGSSNSCAAVGEPVARKARSCRSSVETIPTGRGHCRLRTRRPVVPQSQAKTTPLSGSSSAGGGVGSTRSQHTSISRRRSGRAHSGDGKASRNESSALTVPLKGGSSEGPSDCPAVRRKNASVMTAVPLKNGSEGPSDCPLASHNNASVVTVSLKSGSNVCSSRPAEAAVEHAGGGGGGDGGTRGYMAGVGTDMTDGEILDDAVVTTSGTPESGFPPDTSTPMNDSACSGGGSQVGDQSGVKMQSGLPSSGALADNGKGARTGLTPTDHHLLLGFGSPKNTQSENDESREERHLQKENKDKDGVAKPLCDPCGKEEVLPTAAISRNVPEAHPGACRADDRVAIIPGQLLRQENLLVQGVAREPKQVAPTKSAVELLRQDRKESLLPTHPKTMPRASESRAKARGTRCAASQTEAEVRQDSTRRGSLLPRAKTLPRTSKSRAKARAARYAAAKGAAEKVLKEALEAIEIHNNASVKLAQHHCAEVEAKTAENEQANALLHNRLFIAKVQTQASARNHHLPATEGSRLCTRAREVDIGATSTVARERYGGSFHDNDVGSRQQVNRSESIFHAGQPAEREPDGVQRLSEQEETVAAPPEAQHACLSALLLASAHDVRDAAAEPAAETVIVDAKSAAERVRETAEFAAAALPPRDAEEKTAAAVARETGRVARQESDHRTKDARAVLGGSPFLERDAKEKDAMMMVASGCRKRHSVYLKRQNKFEENAWRVADAGMKSARASIAAEFASIRLHLSQQHAAQLAVAARATAKTSDAKGSLMRRVSVLDEERKDDRWRAEDSSLPVEDCHAETACRIAAMRSRNNARTAARLGALKNNSY